MSRGAADESVFHAIASPTRRALLDALALGESNVSDLVASLDVTQSAVSQQLTILKSAGLVGVAARAALRQAGKGDEIPPSSIRPVDSRPVDSSRVSVRAELVSLLSGAIGAEKAEETVQTAGRKLGLGKILDRNQASAILEELANMPGPIGATARFARARFLLRKK